MFSRIPSPDNDLLVEKEFITLANGHRMPKESPSRLLRQLQQACQDGALEEVERILGKITPLSEDSIPSTAHGALQDCLRTAVEQKHYNIVRAMLQLECGFQPYSISSAGVDAAFHAHDTTALRVFMDFRWDVNDVGPPGTGGMRPLLRHAVNEPDLRTFLLENGASPNAPNNRGLTPLETAAQWSTAGVVKELLEYGGNPAADDSLIHAAAVGRIDVAELLLDKGANVNALEKMLPLPWGQKTRRTALEVAKAGKQQEMVQWLESHGATARNS